MKKVINCKIYLMMWIIFENTDTVLSKRPTKTTERRTSTGSTNSSCSSTVESEALNDDDIKAVIGARQTRVVNQSKGLLSPMIEY